LLEALGSIAWSAGLMEKKDPKNPGFWHQEEKVKAFYDVDKWHHGPRIKNVSDVCDQVALNPSLNPKL